MRRNIYAVLLLAMLLLGSAGAQYKVGTAVDSLQRQVRKAYAYTLSGDYHTARALYLATIADGNAKRRWLSLFVRRSLLDKVGETLSTLPFYANADNAADLAVESARANEQLQQLQDSFFAVF